jgi:hypothetical protein
MEDFVETILGRLGVSKDAHIKSMSDIGRCVTPDRLTVRAEPRIGGASERKVTARIVREDARRELSVLSSGWIEEFGDLGDGGGAGVDVPDHGAR